MEYCEGGDLSTFIKTRQNLSESVCQTFLQQLASALEYLRKNSVSHMDLKPQNLLLTSKTNPMLKLTGKYEVLQHYNIQQVLIGTNFQFDLYFLDFGLAQLLGKSDKETSLRGSPLYMAPEILLRQPYDASVDLVMLYKIYWAQIRPFIFYLFTTL